MTSETPEPAPERQGTNAFDMALLDSHREWLMPYLRSQTGSRDEAEDLMQEVFLVAIRKREQYDSRYRLGAWLRGIARLAVLERCRRENKVPVIATEDAVRLLDAATETLERDAMAQDRKKDRILALRACLSRLAEQMRNMVAMKYFEGVKSTVIAAKFHMKTTTVNVAMARTRILLRQCMEQNRGRGDYE